MGQITRAFAERGLMQTDPNRVDTGERVPLTVWEQHQLFRAWLDREDIRAHNADLTRRLEAAEKHLRDVALECYQGADPMSKHSACRPILMKAVQAVISKDGAALAQETKNA